MASYFVTSFAVKDHRGYANHFHKDLAAEVAKQLGGRKIVAGNCCGDDVSAVERRRLVAEAGVLVALCSPAYYEDEECGRDWALFQRRLAHVPSLRGSAVPPELVLVRWRPVDNRPPDLPRAPLLDGRMLNEYNELGLYRVARRKTQKPLVYQHALRELAARVLEGHRTALPVLPPDDGPPPAPTFPQRVVPSPRPPQQVESVAHPDPEPTHPPRVFISYAHEKNDGGVHARRVRALNDRLCDEGIDVTLDQTSARGPQFWPRWMDESYRKADFVLVIASPTYKRRANHEEEPGVGDGVAFEADYILQQRYRDRLWYRRILLVIFPGYSDADLPDFLGPGSVGHYEVDPDTGEGLPDLVDHILGHQA